MDSGKPQFQTAAGFSMLKVYANEVRYDPLLGKPGARHWAVSRSDVRDVTCERKFGGVNALSFRTDSQAYSTAPLSDDAILEVMALMQPDKLRSDPTFVGMQQHKDDVAAKHVQRDSQMAAKHAQADYQKQLETYQDSQRPEQMMRTYRHDPEKDFRKDAAHLARDGWMVQSQTAGGLQHEGLGSRLTFGVAGKRKVGEITTVYTRQRKPAPTPTAPQVTAPTPGGAPQAYSVARGAVSAPVDPMTQLETLAALHQKGVLTDEEFADKKADILSRV